MRLSLRVMAAAVAAAMIAAAGCGAGVHNYVLPQGPRYASEPLRAAGATVSDATLRAGATTVIDDTLRAGATTVIDDMLRAAAPTVFDDTLRVVSFNIAWAKGVDSALAVLRAEPLLRVTDVLLLQEMDAPSTARMAAQLGMRYVYYPATLHPRTKRDFGNAVLSRWPIVADGKVILPHVALFRRTQRAATAATIRVGEQDVRVYSTHLGTVGEIGFGARRDQLRAIVADAAAHERVIIGGDMNEPWLGGVARGVGYAWPTKDGPRTALVGRVDHIFVRGLAAAASGTVLDNRDASDHRPVWVKLVTRAEADANEVRRVDTATARF